MILACPIVLLILFLYVTLTGINLYLVEAAPAWLLNQK
jgi:hypothetical protein